MEELGFWLLGLCAGVVAVFFVVWTVLAVLLRVFAWVLVAWTVLFFGGLLSGIVVGLAIPVRVLTGRGVHAAAIASPDEVRAGNVLGAAPGGRAMAFDWDWAWPVYNPHQARRDATAVVARTKQIFIDLWDWFATEDDFFWVWVALFWAPVLGFTVGVWASIVTWLVVMALLGGLVYAAQRVAIFVHDFYDRWLRRRDKADLRCVNPGCYRQTTIPSYRCASPACSAIHRDIRPGPLGIVHRRCGCGTGFPTTVGAAAKHLVTLCPFCDTELPKGSGTRQVVMLPVMGAVGAGKTQFLSSGLVGLDQILTGLRGALSPLNDRAEEFFTTAKASIASNHRFTRTHEDLPAALPFAMERDGKIVEIQAIDAAGEYFRDWQRSQALSYIDTSEVLLFVLDPLALPLVHDQLRVAKADGTVAVAQGDPEDSYDSVVERLKASGISLDGKRLAVVMTKVDVLRGVPTIGALDPADSDSVKSWLEDRGGSGLVRRIRRDFKNVSYFAVDSYQCRDSFDPTHPLRVIDWALSEADTRLAVLPGQMVGAQTGGEA
ncbi:MAG: hypothetical protein QM621_09700 [Aeromicrobium sp.]|uniref:TRAFAC clade GTPase domain-containing protein n=1 Tax=Aeromicrobium sp. TaxID=1871063 RepID=UPI0039E6708A